MAEECAEALGCDDELSKLGYTNTTPKTRDGWVRSHPPQSILFICFVSMLVYGFSV
jgi:hypothetical protein